MWDSPYATSHQRSSTLMDRWSLTSLQDEGVDPGNAIKMTSDLRMGSGFLHFFESRSSMCPIGQEQLQAILGLQQLNFYRTLMFQCKWVVYGKRSESQFTHQNQYIHTVEYPKNADKQSYNYSILQYPPKNILYIIYIY